MNIHSLKGQQGFSLVGLFVVLTIVGLIAYYTSQSVSSEQRSLSYDAVVLGAGILGKALDGYYQAHCHEADFPDPTIDNLVSEGFLANSQAIDNMLGVPLSPSIIGVGTTNVNLLVTASFEDSNQALQVADMIGNASRTGSDVIFTFEPTSKASFYSVEAMEMRRYFGEAQC